MAAFSSTKIGKSCWITLWFIVQFKSFPIVVRWLLLCGLCSTGESKVYHYWQYCITFSNTEPDLFPISSVWKSQIAIQETCAECKLPHTAQWKRKLLSPFGSITEKRIIIWMDRTGQQLELVLVFVSSSQSLMVGRKPK
jgi:hypothetical protein